MKRLPTILPKDKFIQIINEEKILKHKCLVNSCFCCGLRVDEVSRIKVEDINSKEHKLRVIGKGNKERYYSSDIVIKLLRLYCKEKNLSLDIFFQEPITKK